jgi:adenine-specific DNA methylase
MNQRVTPVDQLFQFNLKQLTLWLILISYREHRFLGRIDFPQILDRMGSVSQIIMTYKMILCC